MKPCRVKHGELTDVAFKRSFFIGPADVEVFQACPTGSYPRVDRELVVNIHL